ncbi:MAG: hypothetical protein P4L69_12730 [Desulfosporosinus sp.]|nr:hypothetical protein [Desulfosporosinus sp.]
MRKVINQLKSVTQSENFLLASFFIILIFLALLPFSDIPFTTNDDFRNFMNTFSSPISGAIAQGRFQLIYQLPITRFPYLFNSLAISVIIRDLSHVILLLVIAYSFFRITYIKKLGYFVLLFFFSWLQNSDTYNLITAYPLAFHLPLISIFLSFLAFEKFSSNPNFTRGLLIFLLSFYGISVYESFVFLLVLVPFFDKSVKNQLKTRIVVYSPFILSLFLFVGLSFLWRRFFPTNYDGNAFKMSLTDLPLFFKVAFQFTVSALPMYFFFLQKLHTQNAFQLLNAVEPLTIVGSLASLLLSFYLLYKTDKSVTVPKKKLLALIIILIILTFSINCLYGFTAKYRRLVELGSHAYVGTFFSYIFLVILFSIFYVIISGFINKHLNSFIRIVCILVLSMMVGGISLLTGISNHYVNLEEKNMNVKIQLMNQLVTSDFFGGLQDDSIIVAPSLFEDFQYFLPNDWSDFVHKQTGRSFNVVKSLDPDKAGSINEYSVLYIIKTDDNPYDAVLLASTLRRDPGKLAFGKKFYIYSLMPGSLSVMGTYAQSTGADSNLIINSKGLLHYTYNQHTFAVQMATSLNRRGYSVDFSTDNPVIQLSSLQVTRNKAMMDLSNVDIDWGRGFYDLEKNQYGEWRWSDNNSSITIVNPTFSPIKVKMSGKLSTGYSEPSTIKVRSPLFSDTIQLNKLGTIWTQTVELPPGNTQIEFWTDAKQVDAPGDPRHLFFMMTDFTVSPI